MKRLLKALVRFSYFFVYPRSGKNASSFSLVRFLIRSFLFFGFLFFIFVLVWIDIPKIYALKGYRPTLPSLLLDRKGRLISRFFEKNRIMVEYGQIPAPLINAFIATEDNHFYDHFGLDFQAVMRAFAANFQSGVIRQGGSTITQQLAKVILTDRKRTYTRKVKEIIMATMIEFLFTKKEILTLYLNQIYFGHGNYGVEAASRFYFNKSVQNLTSGEAAILAGLPSAPNRYSPVRNPRLSLRRLTHVIMKMIDCGYLSIQKGRAHFQETLTYYHTLNVSPTATAFGSREDKAPYFTEYIRKKLEKEVGRQALYQEGLEIHSTLDLDHQKLATKALWKALEEQSKKSGRYIFNKHANLSEAYSPVLDLLSMSFDIPQLKPKRRLLDYKIWLNFQKDILEKIEVLNLALGGDHTFDSFLQKRLKNNPFQNRYLSVQGAFIEVDHKTGGVTMMVGGAPFSSQNQINRAVQTKRQPGSTFKALVYASAIDSGKVTPATIFSDSPVVFLDQEGDNWIPENYSGGYRGFINIREALTQSANMVSIAVAREVKLSSILPKIADSLGVNPKSIPHNLSVALGTSEVTPLQMVQAFSLFPRGGYELPTHFYTKILDAKGNILKKMLPPKPRRIYKSGTALIMRSMLEDVVRRGTGVRVRSWGDYRGFAAGKTGTSQNFRDVWFVGFNDRYTSGLWMGYDRSSFSLGPGQAGGVVAAPIWGDYQKKLDAVRRKNKKDENPYRNYEKSYLKEGKVAQVNVCKSTGRQENLECPCHEVYPEIFLPGSLPESECDSSLAGGEDVESFDDISESSEASGNPVSDEYFFSGDDL